MIGSSQKEIPLITKSLINLLTEYYIKWKVKPVIPKVVPKEKLETIQVPSLLMMRDKEVIYNPIRALMQAKTSIPHIETLVLPNTSHCLFIEDAKQVNDSIIHFLHKDPLCEMDI